jgi:hypothetical protein
LERTSLMTWRNSLSELRLRSGFGEAVRAG